MLETMGIALSLCAAIALGTWIFRVVKGRKK